MIESPHYTPEHEIFRESVRRFLARECIPHRKAWQEACKVSREVWTKAGETGLLCPKLGLEWGGGGGDLYHGLIIMEEQTRAGFNELASTCTPTSSSPTSSSTEPTTRRRGTWPRWRLASWSRPSP
jgi:alkylation response protein AidB-like acyl-CoA dehydrogenase